MALILNSQFPVSGWKHSSLSPSYAVYISQLIRFVCSNVSDLIKQSYRYHKLHKVFLTFYRIHSELIFKHNYVGLKIVKQ